MTTNAVYRYKSLRNDVQPVHSLTVISLQEEGERRGYIINYTIIKYKLIRTFTIRK